MVALGGLFLITALARANAGEPTSTLAGSAHGPPDLSAVAGRLRSIHFRLQVEQPQRRYAIDLTEPAYTSVSGILFHRDGYILTVGHVLEGAEMISAENHRGEFELCTAIGYDTRSNVGVVRLNKPEGASRESDGGGEDLETLQVEFELLRGEGEPPLMGQPVLALGNPFNLGVTLSTGHVTGLDRTIESLGEEWSGLLQVSLPVNPGDQGGPVAALDGRVLGMLLTRYRPQTRNPEDPEPQGISFALPLAAALDTAEELVEMHESRKSAGVVPGTPWVGVRAMDITDATLREHLRLEPRQGVLIERVFRNSPAERAGLRQNDVIVQFDEQIQLGLRHFGQLIQKNGSGSSVQVIVIRGGERQMLELVIGRR